MAGELAGDKIGDQQRAIRHRETSRGDLRWVEVVALVRLDASLDLLTFPSSRPHRDALDLQVLGDDLNEDGQER